VAWCKEAFHGLGVQDVTEFDSDWCCVFFQCTLSPWAGMQSQFASIIHILWEGVLGKFDEILRATPWSMYIRDH
jgi:hypothetical protein